MVLADRKWAQEWWAARRRQKAALPLAFGAFIAGLAQWDWFLNPLSFRDEHTGDGPPVRDLALNRIEEYLALIERHAAIPIGYMIAEEFGSLGGRFHCHGLLAGVAHLPRKFWWAEAFRRFGYTRIVPFDPARGAAFYAAKYAAKQLGEIHFGGTLKGHDLSACGEAVSQGGCGQSISPSAEMPKVYYRLGFKRWHR